ncbi:MAG: ECF transporter S component [Clostridiales Family XIII bacterium]|jgi:riboflavin transporter FmnP|nr:ECF transporter S component [Clostridiales Family XIII bacterium]
MSVNQSQQKKTVVPEPESLNTAAAHGAVSERSSGTRTRKLVVVAMLSAVAFALAFLEFPVPLSPAFARYDFSDIPALIAAFALGPLAGVCVELVKNVLQLLSSATGGVGELANFIIGAGMVLPAGLIYRKMKTKKGAILGCILGTVAMAVIAGLVNYFILIPMFNIFMPIDEIIKSFGEFMPFIQTKLDVIIYNCVPFNLIKGALISLVTVLLYKRISPILKGRR